MNERHLRAKLRRIAALHAGATTEGERIAAQRAYARVQARLHAVVGKAATVPLDSAARPTEPRRRTRRKPPKPPTWQALDIMPVSVLARRLSGDRYRFYLSALNPRQVHVLRERLEAELLTWASVQDGPDLIIGPPWWHDRENRPWTYGLAVGHCERVAPRQGTLPTPDPRMPITILGACEYLPMRATSALRNAGVATLGHLIRMSAAEVVAVYGISEYTLKEITLGLRRMGLSLREA